VEVEDNRGVVEEEHRLKMFDMVRKIEKKRRKLIHKR
jgi:hypothetical protein